ncbi:DUF397 domain-containing protein [Saccharopolyspora gloriosae]|uniref:DUF397 domain-containing protein n=1 Tax=Saccharopolyspora gloriosae TaxID=455344 RepID=UPI002867DD0C|nr:DUF397 domain-containing protein [Saccharopolyspora gloriosae]
MREPHVDVEARRVGLFLTRPQDVEPFVDGVEDLEAKALCEARSAELIGQAGEELEDDRGVAQGHQESNGNCVEVAFSVTEIAVRDSKAPGEASLRVSSEWWRSFLGAVVAGRHEDRIRCGRPAPSLPMAFRRGGITPGRPGRDLWVEIMGA